jgi:sialidase-1
MLKASGMVFALGSIVTWLLFARGASADDFPTTVVFEGGTGGYPVYRIPTLVSAANGDLLAFCEARQGDDASEIDLVMKRSTDAGKSWGELQVVQESDDFRDLFDDPSVEITIGNPAPVVDLLSPDHSGRVWLPFTLENDRVFVIFSDDHGESWSERREITSDVKPPAWGWYATGPVHSIQLQHGEHRGRLVVPADHRIGENAADRGPNGAQAILSDDHGETWRLGAIDDTYSDTLNANETSVVELNDGRLYFNTRDQAGEVPGTRGEAWSDDGGETFTSPSPEFEAFQPCEEVLDPPVVQCSLLRVRSTLAGDADNLILFCGPDNHGPSGGKRNDLRLRYTTDEAESWQDGPLIHTGPAAYSDMVLLAHETVGIVYEASDPGIENPYQRIVFSVVDVGGLR